MRVLVVGTGLIGASVGLALKALDDAPEVLGWDQNRAELTAALELGAIDRALDNVNDVLTPVLADIYVLAVPVLPILDWMERLAPVLGEAQLLTDVGSTKVSICERAGRLFNQPGKAVFLPGHPMAGKESGGAALAEADLFRGAPWLFTPLVKERGLELVWKECVRAFGAKVRDIDATQHDEVCAWVSHLPQMLSTALAAQLHDTFAGDGEGMAAVQAIGGRGLRETTRLGSSPYSMWRDVAMTNTDNIAAALLALEQRLAHLRENLRTLELREEFARAARFQSGR